MIQTVALFEKYYYVKADSSEEAEKYINSIWRQREKGANDLPYYLGPQLEEDIIFSISPADGKKQNLRLIYNGKDIDISNYFQKNMLHE